MNKFSSIISIVTESRSAVTPTPTPRTAVCLLSKCDAGGMGEQAGARSLPPKEREKGGRAYGSVASPCPKKWRKKVPYHRNFISAYDVTVKSILILRI